MVPTPEQQTADELTVTDAARPVLVRVLRVAFPHEKLPDGPYERTADTVIEAANASTWARLTLLQGIGTLDSVSGGAFGDLDDADALKVLRHVEATDFFGFIRRTAVVALYDDPEVWSALGYEGPSYDKGGYIDRGFDDLDWLPDPRIEEYSGPRQLLEVATDLPPSDTAAAAAPAAASPGEGSLSGASHPGVAPQQAQDNETAEAL
jgi:hypothetical protein